jgi:plastocyanin
VSRMTLAVLAALALAAAGCGSSSSKKSSSSSSRGSAASSSASGGAAPAGGGAIKLQNTAFSPKSTTVKVGQKITWTNEDGFDHNVTAESGATFKSKDFGKGGTFTFTPTKAGTIKYVCTIHPGMSATITVQ